MLYPDSGISMDEEIVLGDMIWSYNKAELQKLISFCVFILTAHSTVLSTALMLRTYVAKLISSFYSEAHALNTISQQLHHMGGACCLHDTGVQKLTLNMLCLFLTSPGEGRPQHYITAWGLLLLPVH